MRAILMVIIVALSVESSRARWPHNRASNPQSLGPTQMANSAGFLLIQRVGNEIRNKCRGNWHGIDVLGYRNLESNGTVFIFKLRLMGATGTQSRYIHVKIREPQAAKVRVVGVEPAKHLWSQLGPCYVENAKANKFGVELPFDYDERSLKWWVFDSVQAKLRSNHPKLFGASDLELMSHRNKTKSRRARHWLFRVKIHPKHKNPGNRSRHAHVKVVEPDSRLLTVEDIQTGVGKFTPIEYFDSFSLGNSSRWQTNEDRCA